MADDIEQRISELENKLKHQDIIIKSIQTIIEKRFSLRNNSSITSSLDGGLSINNKKYNE
jgi:uncharacterized coiled-coil protein SlyX